MIQPARQRLIGVILLVMFFAFNRNVEPVRAETPRELLRRWAILASPATSTTGLSDLLMAELSERKFELVEREQLAAITKEIELSKLLSPEGSAQRLKVGQLTKADALVLLSFVEHDKKKFLKLVISDCRYGSRLRMEHFPFAADHADKLAVEIAQAVVETRTKFARGVERIVAVSPLLSKNVTREFDHLQFAFAALLGQSLGQHPGVAVLEIEEARTIGEELTRSASKLEKQQVPLFVEGEFEITPSPDASNKPGDLGSIRFALRALDGSAERESFAHRAKGRTEAVDWLTKALPSRLLRRDGKEVAATPLNRVQQQEHLARQAEMFSRVAGYPESTALREAVLLLEPDDWKQRIQLVTDHLRWWRLREGQSIAIGKGQPSIWSKELRLHVDAVMSNVEYVLAQRVLNVGEAGTLLHYAMANFHGRLQDSKTPDGTRDEQNEHYKRCLKRIALLDMKTRNGQVDGVIAELYGGSASADSKSVQSQLGQWIGRSFFTTIQVVPSRSRPGDPHVLADVEHLFVEVVPKEQLAQCVLYSQFRKGSDVPSLVTLRHASAKDVAALYERLRATKEPVLQFYARFGLLGLKTSGALQEPVGADDIKEADGLEQFLVEWSRRSPENATAVAAVRIPFKEFRGELEKMFSAGGFRKTVPLTPNPLSGRDPYPRLAFEPLDQLLGHWQVIRKANDDLDVLWSNERVAFLRKGSPVEIVVPFKPSNDRVTDVAWDGTYLWVGCRHSGLSIFDSRGRQVAKLPVRDSEESTAKNAQWHLPSQLDGPGTNRFHLYALAPGRCFATGGVPGDTRRWFGIVYFDPQRPLDEAPCRFELWHKAAKRPASIPLGDDPDVDLYFDPVFLTDYTSTAEPKRRWVLLGRPVNGYGVPARRPMAFDVESGQVSIFPVPIAHNTTHEHRAIHQVGDSFVFNSGVDITRFDLSSTDRKRPPQIQSLLQLDTSPRKSGQPPLETLKTQLLPIDQGLLNPGSRWHRIDTQSWKLESLTEAPVSTRFRFERFGTSAHFGLLAWNVGDRVHRIHLDQSADQPRDLRWLYPFVPEARRQRHAQAVERIRELGGHVDAQWLRYDTVRAPWKTSWIWHTVVYLSEGWTGGDEGLKHLADLHELRRLYFVRAPITNAGLQQLGKLESLRVLRFEETQVTSAGLNALPELPELTELRLEGTVAGNEFGDDSLPQLQRMPALQSLIVYGKSFTDQGLSQLKNLPTVHSVYLLSTSVSQETLKTFKSQSPNVRVELDLPQ